MPEVSFTPAASQGRIFRESFREWHEYPLCKGSFFPVFLIREQNFCFRERKAFSRLGSLHIVHPLPHRKKSTL